MVRTRSVLSVRRHAALAASLVLFAAAFAAACAAPDGAPAAGDAATPAAVDTTPTGGNAGIADVTPIDSTVGDTLAIGALLETFRQGTDSVGALSDALDDRTLLAEAYVRALATQDTAGLVRHLVTRAEYAWLFFPDSPFARPPYQAPPEIIWMMLRSASERGVQKALAVYGGHPATVHGVTCDESQRYQRGRVTLWQYCRTEVTGGEPAVRRTLELFGGILEVDGMFKFLSLGNEL